MGALISKPGLTSASTLSIPQTWSPSWFRNLIANQLTGADVRNAIGANGISVSGTIASPYATISPGSPFIIPKPSSNVTALTVNAVDSNTVPGIDLEAPSGATHGTYIKIGAGGTPVGLIGFGSAVDSGSINDLWVAVANNVGNLILAIGSNPTPAVTIAAATSSVTFSPQSSSGSALTVNGQSGATIGLTVGGTNNGCAVYQATTLTNGLVMNSTGADYGGIANTGTQVWSLGFTASQTTIITPAFSWGETGGSPQLGFFGTAPTTRVTGYGTPTGGSHQGSFAAGSITLANLAAAVAQLIVDLKSYGLVAA